MIIFYPDNLKIRRSVTQRIIHTQGFKQISILLVILYSLVTTAGVAQNKPTSKTYAVPDSLFIRHLLEKNPGKFKKFVDHPDKYKIQIIYTRIDRDKDNVPSFKEFDYNVSRQNYFYCASLVKLPCTLLALEKLNALHIPGLDKDSPMLTDSTGPCQTGTLIDTTSATGYPSLAQYIRRMLLVSDNTAYSRCYEFLGQEYIHTQLTNKGYPDAFIIQRFDSKCGTEDNQTTNAIDFMDVNTKKDIYKQAGITNTNLQIHPLGKPVAGKAYIDKDEKKINEPKDFSHSNFLPLEDITGILRSVLFPQSADSSRRFQITETDRNFVLHYLSMLPRESDHPAYRTKEYYDSFKKYLIYGDNRKPILQDSIRIFNIVGQSYGFVSDVAYVCDIKHGVEFMLSAVIYANEDEVINDNRYDYKTVALPFLADLGKAIYSYDRKRKRSAKPDLKAFKFTY